MQNFEKVKIELLNLYNNYTIHTQIKNAQMQIKKFDWNKIFVYISHEQL